MSVFSLRRVCLQHSKVQRMFLTTKICSLLLTIGDNASTAVHLNSNYFNIKVMRHTYDSLVKLTIINSLLM